MVNTLASILVLLTGLYFVGLAVASLAVPARTTKFLLGFASSAFAHYIELLLRLAVGGAFILRAPYMSFSDAFALLGWVLAITTACLFAIPWQWHRRFAEKTVPWAVRNLKLVAVASLAVGGFILASLSYGNVT